MNQTPSPSSPSSSPTGGSKSILTSRTFAGLALIALPIVANYFGITLDDATTQALVENLFQIIGLAVAAYGRLKASKRLTLPAVSPSPLLLVSLVFLAGCSTATRRGRVTNAALIGVAKFAGNVALASAKSALDDRAKNLKLDFAGSLSKGFWTEAPTVINSADITRIVEAWGGGKLDDMAAPLAGKFAAISPTTPAEKAAVVAAMAKGITDATLSLSPRLLVSQSLPGGFAK